MTSFTIPDEGSYGQIERDWIDFEPPGLLPIGQDSVWGQMRKSYADVFQALADELAEWWNDLDPRTCDLNDIPYWEYELDIPIDTTKTLELRRAFVQSRRQRGAFTRARRASIVESFLNITFGPAIEFTLDGVPFTAGGIPFYSGETSLEGAYAIVETIPDFYYEVRIKNTLSIDDVGLGRELTRITPSGITFDINYVATP